MYKIDKTAIIHPNVKIGEGTQIWYFVVIRSGCVVGINCNIGSHSRLEGDCIVGDGTRITSGVHLSRGTIVGDNCFIAVGTVISNTEQIMCVHKGECGDDRPCFSPVHIGNNVKIGINCTILAGIEIGDNCLIGANSLVTKSVPKNSYGFGAPFKVLGDVRKLRCKYTDKLLYRGEQ